MSSDQRRERTGNEVIEGMSGRRRENAMESMEETRVMEREMEV